MTYKLTFLPSAKKEWDKLPHVIADRFKKKLVERLKNPYIPKDKLHSLDGCYKIKLKANGYRLVYQIKDQAITLLVIAVGKRDKSEVYHVASDRLS